jgi:hypothetical protein
MYGFSTPTRTSPIRRPMSSDTRSPQHVGVRLAPLHTIPRI